MKHGRARRVNDIDQSGVTSNRPVHLPDFPCFRQGPGGRAIRTSRASAAAATPAAATAPAASVSPASDAVSPESRSWGTGRSGTAVSHPVRVCRGLWDSTRWFHICKMRSSRAAGAVLPSGGRSQIAGEKAPMISACPKTGPGFCRAVLHKELEKTHPMRKSFSDPALPECLKAAGSLTLLL